MVNNPNNKIFCKKCLRDDGIIPSKFGGAYFYNYCGDATCPCHQEKRSCCGKYDGTDNFTNEVCCNENCPCHTKEEKGEEQKTADRLYNAIKENEEHLSHQPIFTSTKEEKECRCRLFNYGKCMECGKSLEEKDLIFNEKDKQLAEDIKVEQEKHKASQECHCGNPNSKICNHHSKKECTRRTDCDGNPCICLEEKECEHKNAKYYGTCVDCYPTPKNESWEDRFDEEFNYPLWKEEGDEIAMIKGINAWGMNNALKSFIQKEIEKAKQEAYDEESNNCYKHCEQARQETIKEVLEKIDKNYLKYCREQNGMPYCKNCGLDIQDLKTLLTKDNK